MGSRPGRWIQYARGELPASERRSVEAELLHAAPKAKDFVALLLGLRDQVEREKAEVPGWVTNRARGLYAALAGEHQVTQLIPLDLAASAGVRGPTPAALQAYAGGRFRLELMVIAGTGRGAELELIGQLRKDGSPDATAGETVYLLSDDEKVLGWSTLTEFGELDARLKMVSGPLILALPGHWLRVELPDVAAPPDVLSGL